MIMPKLLQEPGLKFCLLKPRTKVPFEKNWQEKNNYHYDDKKLQEHIEGGGNYGVCTGYGDLVVIDCDSITARSMVEKGLPATFTVKTGRTSSPAYHYYFICNTMDKSYRLIAESGTNMGEIQHLGKQVVGPGCIHPTGNKYEIVKNLPIASTSKTAIMRELSRFIKTGTSQVLKEERDLVKDIDSLRCEDIISTRGFKSYDHRLQGKHPVHGSTSGQNFVIDTVKNCWHCFRCGTGGGPLSLIAVTENIIDCADSIPGFLRGDLAKQAINIAIEKYGLKSPTLSVQKQSSIKGVSEDNKEDDDLPDPEEIADGIMEGLNFLTTDDDKSIYYYTDGIYRTGGESKIRKWCEKNYPSITRYKTNEVIFHIENRTFTDRDRFNNDPNLVWLLNGIFDLGTVELKPFTPGLISTSRLPIAYDPGARCPQIEKAMTEWLPAEQIPNAYELFGYCLLKDYRHQHIFMLLGNGANGKSIFLRLLKHFLGKKNVTNESLQALAAHLYSPAKLFGKLANICGDLSDKALSTTGMLKLLTGGDAISGQHKYKDIFEFVNHAKLVFSANKLPQAFDDSDAFHRRFMFFDFNNQFIGESDNKNLLEELTTPTELSGLFNLAIEGLKRLLENNGFSYTLSIEESRRLYGRKSSPLAAFIDDCVDDERTSHDNYILKEDFYQRYAKYCQENNLIPDSPNKVTRDLPRYAAWAREDREARPGATGKRKTIWKGIVLKGGETGANQRLD